MDGYTSPADNSIASSTMRFSTLRTRDRAFLGRLQKCDRLIREF